MSPPPQVIMALSTYLSYWKKLSVHLQVIIVIESRAYPIRLKLCHVCVVLINKTIWGLEYCNACD